MKKISAFVLLLVALPALAQPVIPGTAMGKTLSDYLDAFNSGDAARIDGFNKAHHFDLPAADQLGFYRQSGGYLLKKVESSADSSIAALIQEKDSDAILRMTIRES